MTILGLDWGARYIGFATADEQGTVITPRGYFERNIPQSKAWQLFNQDILKLRKIIADWEVGKIVLGHPLNADGSASPASDACNLLAKELSAKLELPVALADERLTSWDSRNHGEAAALILRNYLTDQSG